MLLRYINNNILIYHPYSLVVYQDEYVNWERYQNIYSFGLETKQKNYWTCGAKYSWNNKHMKNSLLHYQKRSGCSELFFFNSKNWWRSVHRKLGDFFVRYVTFTSNHVYSFFCNKSMYLNHTVKPTTLKTFKTCLRYAVFLPHFPITVKSFTIFF